MLTFLLPYRVDYEFKRRPLVTYGLVGLNVAVLLLMCFASDATLELLYYRFGFTPERPSVIAVFTSIFIHGGWLHLLGNMWFLFMFGRALEDHMGRVRFFVFYLAAGAAANLIHMAMSQSVYADIPCVGASGAISGILGAFVVLFPKMQISYAYIKIFLIPQLLAVVHYRAYFALGIWLVGQFLFFLSFSRMLVVGGVAFGAHIGGFLFGALLIGGSMAIKAAMKDWSRLVWRIRLSHEAARLAAGKPLDGPAASDEPQVARMRYLARGELPSTGPNAIASWVKRLSAAGDASLIASLGLRAADAGHWTALDHASEIQVARALGALGQDALALGLLRQTLNRAVGEQVPEILYEMGQILWKQPGKKRAAKFCLFEVERHYPQSCWAQSANSLMRV